MRIHETAVVVAALAAARNEKEVSSPLRGECCGRPSVPGGLPSGGHGDRRRGAPRHRAP
ncbi:hypothetical protein [Streptomyces sporangiiformans]|uniref:hypothetical protein n=1 Tax=Streptomyces sporangiiformans TaxID=2315329 RepID=UPI0013C538AE|nr:hypothetical protein [Streptomyces sporangiiformans]